MKLVILYISKKKKDSCFLNIIYKHIKYKMFKIYYKKKENWNIWDKIIMKKFKIIIYKEFNKIYTIMMLKDIQIMNGKI
jgi:hypothetical protein